MNGVTIQEYWARCKSAFWKGIGDWGVFLILLLIAFGAFGLGRLSALEDAQPPIRIENVAQNMGIPAIPAGGYVVASKTGSTYSFPWCSGASRIAEEKQVWFPSEKAAQKAGYRAAKNCKGL